MRAALIALALLCVGCDAQERPTTEVVEAIDATSTPFDRLDPLQHSSLRWLESRTHFPRPSPYNEPGQVVIVGYEALVAAVKAVGELIEENERLRATSGPVTVDDITERLAPPDPVLGDAGLLDLNCFYEKLKYLSAADVMDSCRLEAVATAANVTANIPHEPTTDEEHAAAVREAYLAYWTAHDAAVLASKRVNEVSERARASGLTVGHSEARCGKNISGSWDELWMPNAEERLYCLGVTRPIDLTADANGDGVTAGDYVACLEDSSSPACDKRTVGDSSVTVRQLLETVPR